MIVAPIISLIAPARAADSSALPVASSFAALLSGPAQPGLPVAPDAALPDFASMASHLTPSEPAPQTALPLKLEAALPGAIEAPVVKDVPAPDAPSVAVPEEVAATVEAPKDDLTALVAGDPLPPQSQVIVAPQPVTPVIVAGAARPVQQDPPNPVAEALIPTDQTVPTKGAKASKGDRIAKLDELAPSVSSDQPRAAGSVLPALPEPSTAAKPAAATAAATLVQAGPTTDIQTEAPLVVDAQAGGSQTPAAIERTTQMRALVGQQDLPAPADRLAESAAPPAGPAETGLSTPLSRPVAFSDVYATKHQPVSSPVITARAGTMGREMGVEIASHAKAGHSEMLVRLDPPDMGRIDIRLSFDRDGGLRAVMSADNQGALDLLRRETGDLTRALADAGVKTDAQSFRFDSRGGETGHRGQPHQQTQHGREAGTMSSGIADEQPRYRALRASGRVDLLA